MPLEVKNVVGSTGIATSDDEDTARLVRQVLLGEGRLRNKEALAEGVQVC
jgi:hypothetical protein